MRPKLAILSLAVGAFGIGTTEFSPMGLLPEIAKDVGVSIPAAGTLVSAYALGVMAGAPTMSLLLARFSQKRALLGLMAIFVLGNAAAAISPGFGTLLAARLLTSLSHGAFFGIGAVLAASLVPKERQASALAAMFTGLTVANIGGVPAATWLGQHVGWRATFGCIAGFGVLAITALQLALPQGERCGSPDVRRELGVMVRPVMLAALGTTVLGAGAMFTTYTYVAPMLREIAQVGPSFVTVALVAIGVGFTIGNALGGRLADRSLVGTLAGFLATIAVTSALLPIMLQGQVTAIIGLVVWGIATFGVVPPVQTLVMRRAADAPGLASSVNIGAFNVGNAIGAAMGGFVLSTGFGYAMIPRAGAVLAVLGVVLVLVSARWTRAPEKA